MRSRDERFMSRIKYPRKSSLGIIMDELEIVGPMPRKIIGKDFKIEIRPSDER